MRDPRDEPRTSTDASGGRFYHTESGQKIPISEDTNAEELKELEERMKREQQFPMGMK